MIKTRDQYGRTIYTDGNVTMLERKERDKYGRTVYHYGVEQWKTLVVVVVLPKAYVERYPEEGRYLINDWQMPVWENGVHVGVAPGKITHRQTLKAARELAFSKMPVAVTA